MSDQAAYDVESILLRLKELVEAGRSMPMSASVLVNREEFLELLEESIATLPQELRHSRWLLKEREEFLAKTRREAEDILEQARVAAERMVQRTDIVREAAHTANRMVDEARDESSRLRLEADDYCDQKLAAFEIVLERTQKTVAAGREKLRAAPLADGTPAHLALGEVAGTEKGISEAEEAFFDQDRS